MLGRSGGRGPASGPYGHFVNRASQRPLLFLAIPCRNSAIGGFTLDSSGGDDESKARIPHADELFPSRTSACFSIFYRPHMLNESTVLRFAKQAQTNLYAGHFAPSCASGGRGEVNHDLTEPRIFACILLLALGLRLADALSRTRGNLIALDHSSMTSFWAETFFLTWFAFSHSSWSQQTACVIETHSKKSCCFQWNRLPAIW